MKREQDLLKHVSDITLGNFSQQKCGSWMKKKAHFDRLTGSFVVTVLLSKDILFVQLVSKYVSFHETLPTVTSPYSDTRHVTHAIEKSAERT